MKFNTIKWKIFKYNIVVIALLITLVAIIFNVAVSIYIKNDILGQLNKIANRTEDTALRQGPDYFKPPKNMPPPRDSSENNDMYRFYFMLDRSLREPLSVLNADYILLDSSKNQITRSNDNIFAPYNSDLYNQIVSKINTSELLSTEKTINFNISGINYISIVKPVIEKNSFGLGWIIIFASIEKINQLQTVINAILLFILVFSALIIVIFSSIISKKISAPFSSLNQHIRDIAERNFGSKISIEVDDELQEFVTNINTMSEKLEIYDVAQKTFLQNASHEFRTPLMSIQSYAEGMKYNVVEKEPSVDIIINETKRMTNLIDDLLYLSRLDAIEENYCISDLDFCELINSCVDRMTGIAIKNNIKLSIDGINNSIEIIGDEEKLSRSFTNILSNCIRYAASCVNISIKLIDNNKVQLIISDDGTGFDIDELPNIFDRFYKGKKGIFGLGLAISKNVIERHLGTISAENSEIGAVFRIELNIKT